MTDSVEERVYFAPEQKFHEKALHRFEQVKRKLEMLIPGSDIQHVGSTAVPGSLTKGDLDIQVRVGAMQYAQARQRLCEVYSVNNGGFATSDAISFEDYNSDPSTGIHLTVVGGSCDLQWKFRDMLIASASLRREYDELKRQFEGKSMTEYRNAKAGFVERVLLAETP